jgi:hypothetical protein
MLMVEILSAKLKQIFAKTERALTATVGASAWAETVDSFLREVDAKASDAVDDIAYQFPAALRLKKKSAAVVQTAYFEWVVYSRQNLDWGNPKKEAGILVLHPSVEVLSITAAAANLALTPGVYAIVRVHDQAQVIMLTSLHLEMYEVLQAGDRKYQAAQLIEWMTDESVKAIDDWKMTLADLINWGIVHQNTDFKENEK